MPSLQLVLQLFWACNSCTESAGVTRCNLYCKGSHNVGKRNHCELQKTCYMAQTRAATWNLFKTNSLQSLQKVELSSTFCNRCKPKEVARQLAKRQCYTLKTTCNFSRNAIATQVAKKIAQCNTCCRARFYFLQLLQRFF